MTRNNDEMLMEDDLTAALLQDDDTSALPHDYSNNYEEEPSEEGDDGWDNANEFPGQLAVDVYETADRVIVRARTAGINAEDPNVAISDNILTISGTLSDSSTDQDDKIIRWHIQECYWGEFSRTIAIPTQVHEENIEAELDNGVLTLSFEKEKGEGPIIIPVRSKR